MSELDPVVSIWWWIGLSTAIALMLAVDLYLHRGDRVTGLREAAVWSVVWVGVGLGFGLVLWWAFGAETAGTYLAGYLIEKALSVDNVFFFAMIFGYFSVPDRYQFKVLFWGAVGALAFRLVLIFAAAELLQSFSWMAYLLGVFLIGTAVVMLRHRDGEGAPDRNPVVRLVTRVVPTVPVYDGDRFFTHRDGRRVGTLLFVVLVAVMVTDVVFAVDSVAAILAITTSTFLVWSANAFAVLGLQSLYFCLAGLLRRFVYLKYGMAVLLAGAGLKLILSETPVGAPTLPVVLGFVVITLGVSIGGSLAATRNTVKP